MPSSTIGVASQIAVLVAAAALVAAERDGEHRLEVLDGVGVDVLELGEPPALVVAVVQQPVVRLLAHVERALVGHVGGADRTERGRNEKRGGQRTGRGQSLHVGSSISRRPGMQGGRSAICPLLPARRSARAPVEHRSPAAERWSISKAVRHAVRNCGRSSVEAELRLARDAVERIISRRSPPSHRGKLPARRNADAQGMAGAQVLRRRSASRCSGALQPEHVQHRRRRGVLELGRVLQDEESAASSPPARRCTACR